ncbi:AarF/UbiB family protein [Sphaerotilus sp.]|uniref:ABC1 kinase family protein n=1 Tax=Sphaerotilus sp. TaxID=2093942 RepID=UPI00286E5F9E|nr:AarF/UbiB family protein [Sphaerotilus sp.]
MPFATLTAARDLGRLQGIAAVFIRHGLGDLVRRLGWADRLARAGHALHLDHAADLARLDPPVQLRLALEELGPTFVKLGQILAGRADLFGPAWIAEFEKLHSQAPTVDPALLRAQLTEDLGAPPEEVFARFDAEPLAAASIAQVHAAALHDGTEVVVKVRRPGIGPVIEADLRLLERQFGRSLRRELDLSSECHNAEHIAANFADRPHIVVPQVYWDWTRERVNVQERIVGIPGNDLARVDATGLDRTLLAQRGANAVLQMIIDDGFFHADPHPGNVFYLPGNRLAFIDFGMMGRLSETRRDQLLSLMLGLVQREPEAVVEVLLAWTQDAGPGAGFDQDALQQDVVAFVDQYRGTALAKLSLGGMLGDVTAILREYQLALPADLALLIKTFITLEGLGRTLAPEFHMATEAQPLLEAALRARYAPQALAQRGWTSALHAVRLLTGLPREITRLMRLTKRTGVQVHVEVRHLEQVADQLDRAVSRLTVAMVVAALIIGSSIVMTVQGGPTLFGLPAFGLLGFLAAGGGALWLAWSVLRSGRASRALHRAD